MNKNFLNCPSCLANLDFYFDRPIVSQLNRVDQLFCAMCGRLIFTADKFKPQFWTRVDEKKEEEQK